MSSAMSRFWAIACRNHRQLSHRRIVLSTLQRSRILSDLQANKDQRYDHTNRSNDVPEVGYLLE